MRFWRQWVTLGMITLLVAAGLLRRDEMAEAASRIGGLSGGWLLGLSGVTALGIIVNGAHVAATAPGLTVRRGVMVQQATIAANSTIVGGGPIATGLRISMLRSWRVDDHHIGVSIVAQNLVASYAVWTVALGTALLGLAGPTADIIDSRLLIGIAIVAVVVLGGATVMWWALLRHPRCIGWAARHAQRLWDAVRCRVRRLPEADLGAIAEEGRHHARHLARAHGGRIITTALVEQSLAVVRPILVVRALGIGPEVLSVGEIVVAHGLIRLATALTPIPGGLGVADLGLVSVLARFGATTQDALAVAILIRSIALLLPLATGGVCLLLWRRQRSQDTQWAACDGPAVAADDVGRQMVRRRQPA